MAVRIAIVEDEKSAARALEQAIQRYGTENTETACELR